MVKKMWVMEIFFCIKKSSKINTYLLLKYFTLKIDVNKMFPGYFFKVRGKSIIFVIINDYNIAD